MASSTVGIPTTVMAVSVRMHLEVEGPQPQAGRGGDPDADRGLALDGLAGAEDAVGRAADDGAPRPCSSLASTRAARGVVGLERR